MAEDPSNDVSYFLEIGRPHLDYLGPVRHWSQLRTAAAEDAYWVRGLTAEQLESTEIRSIPLKKIYYMRDDQSQLLFPIGAAVPVKRLPSGLLWTPLEKAMPLEYPSYNHNYFGLSEKLPVRLAASSNEEDPVAMLVSARLLGGYIKTAPAVRLEPLSWVIVDDQALLLGNPLLPLPGKSYWRRGNHLLPAGLDLEWPLLAETLDRQMNPQGDCWLVWEEHGGYLEVKKESFRPLSISSFRLSESDIR
ncbi:hypothetical protein ACQ86N_11580 [Puia sp. P3]|uniref:hypothetical protein n=1 Tax=Puia sp. P3 TaxID=3423952 RepID=UPI003D67712C